MSTPTSPRCVLIADFTVSGLMPFLSGYGDEPALNCIVAPFDQVVRHLIDGGSECWSPPADAAVVWTRPDAAIPSFGRLLEGHEVAVDAVLTEVDAFAAHIRTAAGRVRTLFVPAWTMPGQKRGMGLLNLRPEGGPRYALLRMNARLAEQVTSAANVFILDSERWIAAAGASAVNPKLWHLGKIAFGVEVFKQAAQDIRAGLRAIAGQSRKLIALDLDDTLWGGVVGEIGWENVKLGGHDPVGEAFAAFQRALAALTRRGIVLGIVSKNTEAIALEAIDRHSEMILRRPDFVAWRINWDDKVANLVALAKDVNVGLDSVVFIDDNPVERARVREALPMVLVPDWPTDKLLYEKALGELTCFDAAAISTEDRIRTRMYVSDRLREEAKQPGQSLQEHLASLGLQVAVERLGAGNLQRAAQLLNKTNQMNLTTRRMTEAELGRWANADGHCVYVFRVADRFDDHGLTGLASLSVNGADAAVADFLLSCRVLGRGVEETILHCLTELARRAGAGRVLATCRPTPRNAPCQDFFESRSGFERDPSGAYVWSLSNSYPAPAHVRVRGVVVECTAGAASPGDAALAPQG